VDVVVLRGLVQAAGRAAAVDHPATHGDGRGEDMLKQAGLAGMAHGIDAALREGEVDGPGEVEQRRGGVPEICGSSRESVVLGH
jgi:hypothetical protein